MKPLTPEQLEELENKIRDLVPELREYHPRDVLLFRSITLEHCREALLRHQKKTDNFTPTEKQHNTWLDAWYGIWTNWDGLKPWQEQTDALSVLYEYLICK